MNTLPPGWAPIVVGDVLESWDRLREPLNADQRASRQGPYPYYGANGQVDSIDAFRYDGDFVLVAEDGGYFDQPERGVAYAATGRFWVNNHAHVLRPRADLPLRYFLHALNAIDWMPYVGGSTRLKLTAGSLERVPLVLPPVNEQRRIVAKLDAVFEQTRAAKARLERLPALLEKLKRSILAAAFRGDLTSAWRATRNVEPTGMMDRIRAERRRRWEDALRAKGKDPGKATYEEPSSLDVVDLPPLPTGWSWAPLELLLCNGGLAYGVLKPGSHVPNGIPMLRVMDFNDDGEMTGTQLARISSELHAEFSRTRLEAGDVLLSVMATIGRTMVVPNELAGGNVNRAIAVLKPLSIALRSDFLVGVFRSPHFREQVVEQTLGTAQPRINLGDVARFPVPVPPLAEQAEIERLLREMIGGVRSRQVSLERAPERVSQLEHAALAKAFRGELVPQDSTDEPASVLLDRIRAARAAEPERPRRRRGPRREVVASATVLSPTNVHATDGHRDESLDLVVGVFQIDRRLTVPAIAEATGLETSEVAKALKLLVEGGQVQVHGRARGATYEWNE